jgi:hypothetical protein
MSALAQSASDGVCVRQKRAAAVNTRQNEKHIHKPRSRFLAEVALATFFRVIMDTFPRRILHASPHRR